MVLQRATLRASSHLEPIQLLVAPLQAYWAFFRPSSLSRPLQAGRLLNKPGIVVDAIEAAAKSSGVIHGSRVQSTSCDTARTVRLEAGPARQA